MLSVVLLYGCSSGSEKPFRKIDGYALTKTIYETPPSFNASELLPKSILSGPLHDIREKVINDGLENEFIIDSEFGELQKNSRCKFNHGVRCVCRIASLGCDTSFFMCSELCGSVYHGR